MSKTNQYYLDLVTSEYKNSPKFTAWLTGFIQHITDSTEILNNMDTFFSIDTAIGAQLDILGVIIGVNRLVTFQPSNGISPILDDDTYRILLKSTILKNQWDGLNSSVLSIWNILFSDTSIVIKDNQNMTENIFISGNPSSIVRDLIVNGYIVPKPQGVRIYYYYTNHTPFFGFDLSNNYVSGFDTGYWAHSNDPIPFGFDENDTTRGGFDSGSWIN